MLVAPIAATGRLTVVHEGPWSVLALVQLAVMALLVVLALPKRARHDPDQEATA
jgi:hypothetical protein